MSDVTAGGVAWSPDSFRLHAVLPSEVVPEIHVNLSDEAHQSWQHFARRQGVTVSALLEVIGRRLGTGEQLLGEELIIEARELAHDRRRAGGPRKKA